MAASYYLSSVSGENMSLLPIFALFYWYGGQYIFVEVKVTNDNKRRRLGYCSVVHFILTITLTRDKKLERK